MHTDEWGGGGQKGPLPKICRTYPTMMKLDTVIPSIKEIQITLRLLTLAFFRPTSATFFVSRNTDTDCTLRILTRKKHRQIKLHCLYGHLGRWYIESTLYTRFLT